MFTRPLFLSYLVDFFEETKWESNWKIETLAGRSNYLYINIKYLGRNASVRNLNAILKQILIFWVAISANKQSDTLNIDWYWNKIAYFPWKGNESIIKGIVKENSSLRLHFSQLNVLSYANRLKV